MKGGDTDLDAMERRLHMSAKYAGLTGERAGETINTSEKGAVLATAETRGIGLVGTRTIPSQDLIQKRWNQRQP